MTTEEVKLLMEALENGIIDIDDVRASMEMKKSKRAKLLKAHKYKIWQGKNGDWYTYLPDLSRKTKRRLLRAKDQKVLENKVIKYYKETCEKPIQWTLEMVYPQWLDYFKLHTRRASTVKRYTTEWTRFYLHDEIIKIPLKKLDKLTLDEWVHRKIKEHDLTKKQYYTMSFIIRRCMEYAEEKGWIDDNVFPKVKIARGTLRKVKKKPDETQVYLHNEEEMIIQAAWEEFSSNMEDTAPLMIILEFYLGLRPGEMAAVMESDIANGVLHVQRMEIREYEETEHGYYKNTGVTIAEHTKTEAGDRRIDLVGTARDIIDMVKNINKERGFSGSYLFMDKNGERIKESIMTGRLRKYCEQLNIPYRSPHKMRKTVISKMLDAQMNINTVRKFAGHEDEKTTYNNYCFDVKRKEEIRNQLEEALDRNHKYGNIIVFNRAEKPRMCCNQM